MPITHPALPDPGAQLWRYVLSCGHSYVGGKIDNPYSPVLCKHDEHAEPGALVSIVRLERQ